MERNESDIYVFPDIHTRIDILEPVLALPGLKIGVGDIIDGRMDERTTLSMCRDSTETVVLGNHETDRIQVIRAAMQLADGNTNHDPDLLYAAVDQYARSARFGRLAFNAYDISEYTYTSPVDRVLRLLELMERSQLFSYICSLPPYYENTKKGIIVVHAGLTEEPWEAQKQQLDEYKNNLVAGKSIGEDPPQIYSQVLAGQSQQFRSTGLTVISGHQELREDQKRITAHGRRVRLANSVKKLQPMKCRFTMCAVKASNSFTLLEQFCGSLCNQGPGDQHPLLAEMLDPRML